MALTQLHVGSLGGLHHELYHPDTDALFINKLPEPEDKALLYANALFWGQHLEPRRVLELAQTLARCTTASGETLPAYRAIASEPEVFVSQVEEATLWLCDQSIGTKRFYKYVETLMLLCQLYSDLEYRPHVLTLYEGFTLFELSSLVIYENCLKPSGNPYIGFINKFCMPVIEKAQPDLIWINGRITMASMAIARLSKELFPNVHISVVGHSSEYYSLNKLIKHLIRNTPLFSMIDSIILDDREDSRRKLIEALSKKRRDLAAVPNIIYADREAKELRIRQTSFFAHKKDVLSLSDSAIMRVSSKRVSLGIDPSSIVDLKLFPSHACYWNKCSFCGINKKYQGHLVQSTDSSWDVSFQVEAFKVLADKGYDYIWAIDEAIPAKTLHMLAKGLIRENVVVAWQARSRFSRDFLEPDVAKNLAKSGLKEIRFGLESASPRILKLMKKFPDSVTFGLIRNVIDIFDKNGISVHCPVIIGYPSETAKDRQLTYSFLSQLCSEFPKFSFNINIFSLDIKSPLFQSWEQHGISAVKYPCHPDYFIGNLLDWESYDAPFKRGLLERERNRIMRHHLYPWMPDGSLTLPHIFYRLCETIRNTLTFKTIDSVEKPRASVLKFEPTSPLYRIQEVVISKPGPFREDESHYQLYNWETHSHAAIDRTIAQCVAELPSKILDSESSTDPKSHSQQRALDKSSLLVNKEKDRYKALFLSGFLSH